MKILIVHNAYNVPGGEEGVVRAETDLLRRYGHEVVSSIRSNRELSEMSFSQKIRRLMSFNFSREEYQGIRRLIRQHKPSIVHFHNIFYMLTPSVYYACQEESVPIVQTLHNFRLLCLNALLLRNGQPCEECEGHNFAQGIKYKCFKHSFFHSFMLARMIKDHWRRGTWPQVINQFIALSEFSKAKFVRAGIPPEKISVKPNFAFPYSLDKPVETEDYALYVGRLSEEKGIIRLLEFWKGLGPLKLKVVGDGPLAEQVKQMVAAKEAGRIEWLGPQAHERCLEFIARARFVIVPSLCYENFPKVIVEAFSCGTPVLGSRRGSVQEIVEEGKTGMLFDSDDQSDFIAKAKKMFEDDALLRQMKKKALDVYEIKYTPERNYNQLIKIYESVTQ